MELQAVHRVHDIEQRALFVNNLFRPTLVFLIRGFWADQEENLTPGLACEAPPEACDTPKRVEHKKTAICSAKAAKFCETELEFGPRYGLYDISWGL